MCKKVFILLVVGLLVNVAYPVTIVNPSFELPGTDKQNNWDGGTNDKGTFVDVPGWTSDTMAADSGVETGWNATDGEWTGFMKGADDSIWQLTDYVIGADDVLVLQIDAADNWAATTLRMTIYYDDAGARVPAASLDVEVSDMQTYAMTFVAADAPDSIGKVLGIELDNVSEEGESWLGIDNVRLAPPPPLANIIYVTSAKDQDIDGVQDNLSWVDWLEAEGYAVDIRPDNWVDPLDANDIAELEAADLIIASRGMSTGDYDGDEAAKWNAITTPMICTNAWMIRSNRWIWMNSTSANKDAGSPVMSVVDSGHPIFSGVALDPNGLVEILDPNVGSGHTSFLTDILDVGNGTLLAKSVPGVYDTAWIVEWPAGVEYYEGAGLVTGGPRILFMAGTQDDPYLAPNGNISPVDVLNLNEAGQQMFLNAVNYMLPLEATHSYNFEDGTAVDGAGSADGTLVGNAAVRGGALDLDSGGYMSMPGDVIAMNTYDEVSVELWFTSVPGGNTGFHMITAFGEEATGALDWAGYKYLFLSPARGDDVSRAAIQTRSMDDSPWDDETGVSDVVEHDDGLQHHFVCTINATDLTFYVDGALVGSTALDPNNAISGIGTDVAYIGKGVYPADPCWVGSVEELNIYDRALSGVQVAARNAAGPVKFGPEPVDPGVDGLLAYYPLDAAYRGSVPDASGNGNDGTVMGDPAFVPGIVAQAMDLDGDGDYVDCGANPLFGMQETNEMTAACWLTIRSIPAAWAGIVAKGEHAWRMSNVNLDNRFHFGISFWTEPTPSIDGVTVVGMDEWHHVAGVYGNGSVAVYLDGALDASAETSTPIMANEFNVEIGRNPEGTDRTWDGLIDELLIYNRALSENEVLFLAQ